MVRACVVCGGRWRATTALLTVTSPRRWRIVDYVWWACNLLEIALRMASHRMRFWFYEPGAPGTGCCGGTRRPHIRNMTSVAVLALAAVFSATSGLDGFFFILGSLRLPLILAYVPVLHAGARVRVWLCVHGVDMWCCAATCQVSSRWSMLSASVGIACCWCLSPCLVSCIGFPRSGSCCSANHARTQPVTLIP